MWGEGTRAQAAALLPLVTLGRITLPPLQALAGQDARFLPSSCSICHKGQVLIQVKGLRCQENIFICKVMEWNVFNIKVTDVYPDTFQHKTCTQTYSSRGQAQEHIHPPPQFKLYSIGSARQKMCRVTPRQRLISLWYIQYFTCSTLSGEYICLALKNVMYCAIHHRLIYWVHLCSMHCTSLPRVRITRQSSVWLFPALERCGSQPCRGGHSQLCSPCSPVQPSTAFGRAGVRSM